MEWDLSAIKDADCDGCSAPIYRTEPIHVIVREEEVKVYCRKCNKKIQPEEEE